MSDCRCVRYREYEDGYETCECGHLIDCHDFSDRFGPDPRECTCIGIVEPAKEKPE